LSKDFRLAIWLAQSLGEMNLQWRDRSGIGRDRLHRIPHQFPARATGFPKSPASRLPVAGR